MREPPACRKIAARPVGVGVASIPTRWHGLPVVTRPRRCPCLPLAPAPPMGRGWFKVWPLRHQTGQFTKFLRAQVWYFFFLGSIHGRFEWSLMDEFCYKF